MLFSWATGIKKSIFQTIRDNIRKILNVYLWNNFKYCEFLKKKSHSKEIEGKKRLLCIWIEYQTAKKEKSEIFLMLSFPSTYEELKQKLPKPSWEAPVHPSCGRFGGFKLCNKFPKPSTIGEATNTNKKAIKEFLAVLPKVTEEEGNAWTTFSTLMK